MRDSVTCGSTATPASPFINHWGTRIAVEGAMWAGAVEIRRLVVPESRLLQHLQILVEVAADSCVPKIRVFERIEAKWNEDLPVRIRVC